MAAPYFPVDMSEMKAQRGFYNLEQGRVPLDDVMVEAMWLNHPQGCMGFPPRNQRRSAGLCHRQRARRPEFDKNVRKLAAGADVLIYDAQYLPEEYEARKRGWGHSHWREAINVVMESGAKELVLFHHDPDHDDACIDKVVEAARNHYPKVRAAAEGLEIEL